MSEYSAETSVVDVEIGSDLEERFLRAYEILVSIEYDMQDIEERFHELKSMEIDVCNIGDLIDELKSMVADITEMIGKVSRTISEIMSGEISLDLNINIPQGSEIYAAMQIIMKYFKLFRLWCDKTKVCVEKYILEITKKVLMSTISGKGATTDAAIESARASLAIAGQQCNIILDAINQIVSTLNTLTNFNIEGGACCIAPTPKSIQKVAITIANTNSSLTNLVSDTIDEAITKASETINDAKGEIKKAQIAASAASGAAAAAIGNFVPMPFGALDKFNPDTIKGLINTILASLLDAEPLPRYEKLHIYNIRFMTYLMTGFNPAAQKSFGIPGQP